MKSPEQLERENKALRYVLTNVVNAFWLVNALRLSAMRREIMGASVLYLAVKQASELLARIEE